MSKKTTEPKVQAKKTSEMKVLPPEHVKENPRKEKEEGEPEELKLRAPAWNVLNGSQKIAIQKYNPGWKAIAGSSIISPGSTRFDPPSPNEVKARKDTRTGDQFFVVAYDDDINLHYRKEKLKVLDLPEYKGTQADAEKELKRLKSQKGNTKETQEKINIKIEQLESVLNYEKVGILDIICLGDEVVFNVEHFMPVDMGNDFYIIHYTDALACIKGYPRFRLERQIRE